MRGKLGILRSHQFRVTVKHVIPASSVITVTAVLYGPTPAPVTAAIVIT